jgi:hypothetical protein
MRGARDVPPAKSEIVNAKQLLQKTLHSLDCTPITVPPYTTVDAPMTPDDVPVEFNGDPVTVCKNDLEGLGEFVNMRKTLNTCHLDFPKLYPPVLHNDVCSYYVHPNTNRATRECSATSYPIWQDTSIRAAQRAIHAPTFWTAACMYWH